MPTHPDIRDQAYQFFLEEAPELLQTIESGLLALRQGRDTGEVHQIMRAAHSLKGGAASVGLEPIKAIAHRLETLFKALYSETLTLDSDLESQLLSAFDCLRQPLTEQLTQGYFDGDLALAQADPILQGLEIQLASAIAETENFLPSSSDLGFDMATSIFEVDVQQGLDRLVAVLEQPNAYEVAGELRAQAEIFLGFAELLDLPGFAQIAQTALQALATNPHRAVEITRLALEDFRRGREAVLSQEPTTGGEPSAALSALVIESAIVPGSPPAAPEPLPAPQLSTNDWWATLSTEAEALEWLAQNQALTAAGLGDLEELVAQGLAPSDLETDPSASAASAAADQPPAASASASLEALFGDGVPQVSQADLAAGQPSLTLAVTETVTPLPEQTVSLPSASAIELTVDTPALPLTPGLTVRVDTQRLARLENQLGELTINRNGLALQTNQIRLALKELVDRFERVRGTVEQLQGVSDQILIAPERQRQPVAIGAAVVESAGTTARALGFDSLEMDTYTALYTYTQTLLEEMVQLEEVAADIALFNRQSDQLLGQHRKMLAQVQDDLMYARMVPLGQVFNRFPRVLRDLANAYGKPAELTLEGVDLLVDKAVLEKLYDPLLHLLRNGFDHGLELPAERTGQGKPEVGQMAMRAYYRGRQVVIEVSDDGRGLDLERVRQRLVALGWLTAAEATEARADQLSRYIFEPGFSTAEQVSELSGRGIGLDVVREQIRLLKGTVAVQSVAGQGTQFILSLPMTLSIVNLLICFVGSTPIAFRSDSITEILIPRAEQLTHQGGQPTITWQNRPVSLYRLSDLLSYRCLLPEIPLSQVLAAVPSPSDWEAPVLMLARGDQVFAIQVDRLVTEQESVIKPFGTALSPPPYAYGCTVLGDGSLVPVIDGNAFLDYLLNRELAERSALAPEDSLTALAAETRQDPPLSLAALQQTTTVLVVDDAVTSRRTLAISLERVGYRVLQARDGQEALEQLQQNAAVRLIVCDIEMPNMNGFEFLTQRRQDPALAQIPTLMLTSRSNDKHRWLALQLGATDYFTKPYLEQEFLGAIADYLKAAQA